MAATSAAAAPAEVASPRCASRVDAVDARSQEFEAFDDPGGLSQLTDRFLQLSDADVVARARFVVPPGDAAGGPGDLCHAARLEDAGLDASGSQSGGGDAPVDGDAPRG